jgi:hypothetical protein
MRARRNWMDNDESRSNLQKEVLFHQITFLGSVLDVLERNSSGRNENIDLLSKVITGKRNQFLEINSNLTTSKKEN